MKKCNNCGGEYQSYERNSKFCSKSCSAIFNNLNRKSKPKICQNCHKEFKAGSNTQKTCSYKCSHEHRLLINLKALEDGTNKSLYPVKLIKKYLIQQNNKCCICGLEPYWNNMPLKLVLDHIDGNPLNHSLDNLRLVCHNCDSQLDTYKGKNAGNGRFSRRQRYKEGKSF